MLNKEQTEIVEFTRAEIGKYSIEDQAKMYSAICMVACIKWPEHAKELAEAYIGTDVVPVKKDKVEENKK